MHEVDDLYEVDNSNMPNTVANKLLSSITVFLAFLSVINTVSEKVLLEEVIEPSLTV